MSYHTDEERIRLLDSRIIAVRSCLTQAYCIFQSTDPNIMFNEFI